MGGSLGYQPLGPGDVGEPPGGRPGPAEPPAAPARHPGRRHAGLVLGAVLLALASGGAGAALAVHYDGHTTTVVSGAPASTPAGNAGSGSLASVAAAVLPSVVTITVRTSTHLGEGSGVIIGSDGTILTNNHVIEAAADGTGTLEVAFSNGRTAGASVVGQDRTADIAVIRAAGVSGVKPAVFGTASALRVGDTVLAVGSPLGLAGSVTSGIVSALDRTITVGSGGQSASQITGMIQTDTAINPGNSGGALVNDAGQVVGITTAIATTGGGYIGQQSGSIGVGFAIPAETAAKIAARLLSG